VKAGELWRALQKYHGQDGPILAWQAASATMNPTLDPEAIAAAYAEDPVAVEAEYGGRFRDPLGAFVPRAVIDRSVRTDAAVTVGDPSVGYALAVDVAGGSGEDSFAVAVAHAERDRTGHVSVVVGFVGERRPPFAPTDAVAEVAAIAGDLGTRDIYGDRSSFAWVEQEFRAHGLEYRPIGSTTSENLLTLLSLLNSDRVSLPQDETLVRQLGSLQRRVFDARQK
jgi:hypothetical protein